MIEVFVLKIEYDDIIPRFDELMPRLCKYRYEKAEKLKIGRAKAESVATGLLLQKVLSEKGYSEMLDSFSIAEKGKPSLSGIEFSISHTDGIIAIGVSDKPIGIDIEGKSDKDFRIAKRFFTEAEQNYVYAGKTYEEAVSHQDDESMKRFRNVWTMKEAYIKLTGTGMSVPISRVSVDPERLTGEVDSVTAYYSLRDIDRYVLAVSSFDIIDDIKITTIDDINSL